MTKLEELRLAYGKAQGAANITELSTYDVGLIVAAREAADVALEAYLEELGKQENKSD